MQLYFTLPLPLTLNQLYINEYKWNPKLKMKAPTGRRILSDKGVMNKKLIQKYARKQLQQQEWDYEFTKDNYIYMDTIIYFPKKGADDNNLYKILCDSLEKIVYDNDSRVLIRTQKIFYDADNPHIEVSIHPVDYIGIFDNKEEMEAFEENCKSCKRYLNGRCSLLVRAKEGRIQNEINDVECAEFVQKKGK